MTNSRLIDRRKLECKRLRAFISDEKHGNNLYLAAAKREWCAKCKHAYKVMAKDERKHLQILKRIYKARCLKKKKKS